MCYCPPGKFCHRHLLVSYLIEFDEDTDKLIEILRQGEVVLIKGPDAEAAYTKRYLQKLSRLSGLKYLAPDWDFLMDYKKSELAKWRIAEKRNLPKLDITVNRRKKKR
ncbi:hypothetical protein SPFM12_00168 [Salmonella phage SPFM12]|nr:hypothetical protein SPFM12_00168 [Salmonella phage SPFM12]